ncbi:uncharacterized protein BP5553_01544 [Venustampulla echinocandica]|uniref:Uncharacterized protein n=1 Tax=Venustampulla echinocandica TaxID=2656787 RepID=A0A370U1C7_9HELO|nr:uncharacterized protein BP5553_01544 [Venustampulla echinocandica]RDL41565.1 hypothetical protein BP5553_01544 [Venustampulla echinocandica]
MRQLSRDPLASSKARKAEAKANSQSGLISIKLGGETGQIGGGSGNGGGGGGFKKGGFKKAGFKSAFAPADGEVVGKEEVKSDEGTKKEQPLMVVDQGAGVESDTEDEAGDMYDPRHPTD